MRKTKHRRRFHTDRIVEARRARFKREALPSPVKASNHDEWIAKRLSYGRLADRDPWDCGNPRCGLCHYQKQTPARTKAKRAWQTVELNG